MTYVKKKLWAGQMYRHEALVASHYVHRSVQWAAFQTRVVLVRGDTHQGSKAECFCRLWRQKRNQKQGAMPRRHARKGAKHKHQPKLTIHHSRFTIHHSTSCLPKPAEGKREKHKTPTEAPHSLLTTHHSLFPLPVFNSLSKSVCR